MCVSIKGVLSHICPHRASSRGVPVNLIFCQCFKPWESSQGTSEPIAPASCHDFGTVAELPVVQEIGRMYLC